MSKYRYLEVFQSRSVSEGSFNFEVTTRVDCSLIFLKIGTVNNAFKIADGNANSVDADQTALQEQSDQHLHC